MCVCVCVTPHTHPQTRIENNFRNTTCLGITDRTVPGQGSGEGGKYNGGEVPRDVNRVSSAFVSYAS